MKSLVTKHASKALFAGLLLAVLPAKAALIIGNYNGAVVPTSTFSNAITYTFGKSVGFTMGSDAYTLDSVNLPLFSPGTATYYTPKVEIWTADGSNTPGTLVATLNNPSFVATSQDYQFTPGAPLTLAAGTSYFLVVGTVETTAGKTEFLWKRSNATGDTNFSASVAASYIGYVQGGGGTPGTWSTTSTNYPWFSINGTEVSAVPEPSAFAALAGAGALGFCALRRRRR